MVCNLLCNCKIPQNIKIEEKKNTTYLKNDDLKIYFFKNQITLNFFSSDFGQNAHQISAEEAKKKHLGTTKCILNPIEDNEIIKFILRTYFRVEFAEICRHGVEEQHLKEMSEDELVDLYRSSTIQREKDKIFRVILYFKYYKTRTWNEYIRYHVTMKSSQLKNFRNLEIDDLYQDAICAFSKVVSKWYNKNEESCFSTYAIRTIDNYTNRVFMIQNKKKRQSNKRTGNEIGLQDNYLGNKIYEDVVSNENVGNFRTVEKVMSFDQHLFYKSLLDYLTKTLAAEEVEESEKPIYNDINTFIKNKLLDKEQIRALSLTYHKSVRDIIEIKRRIIQNREKLLFKDIIFYCYAGLKGSDQILAEKYNRSRAQITKSKSRLTEFCKSKLGAINLTVQDIFERR